MLPAPRIIAIDDELKHLQGLANGLNQYGFACIQVHFTGDTENVEPCPHVRMIFADLHLGAGPASDHARDFGIIGGFIEKTVKPSGPYLIVLWTMYPEQADNLQRNLEDRLEDVTKPFAVLPLDKTEYLDETDNVNTEKLFEAIESIAGKQPQIGALLNWEKRVSEAAADTISSIFSMVGDGDRAQEVGRLLARLAVEAAGENRIEQDHFHPVNKALLPILADHIASLRLRDNENETWLKAFDNTDIGTKLCAAEAAKLNSRVHIASTEPNQGAERGAVIPLPKELSDTFQQTFSLSQEVAAERQFCCQGFATGNDRFRWVLVQSQAACDYAQNQPGSLPYYVGLELPKAYISKSGKPPAALWTSPPFEREDTIRLLRVSARFQVSLSPADAKKQKPLYRLREQLLNELIYQIHSYGSRPGILSFH